MKNKIPTSQKLRGLHKGSLTDSLHRLFQIFQPCDVRRELECWQQAVLPARQKIYEAPEARAALLAFIPALMQLTEAFYLLYRQDNNAAGQYEQQLSKKKRKRWKQRNRPRYLSRVQQGNPLKAICRLAKKFSKAYTRVALADLLETLIVYEGPVNLNRGNLFLLYQWLGALTRLAHRIRKNLRRPSRTASKYQPSAVADRDLS